MKTKSIPFGKSDTTVKTKEENRIFKELREKEKKLNKNLNVILSKKMVITKGYLLKKIIESYNRGFNTGTEFGKEITYNKAINDFVKKGKNVCLEVRIGNRIEKICIYNKLLQIAKEVKNGN